MRRSTRRRDDRFGQVDVSMSIEVEDKKSKKKLKIFCQSFRCPLSLFPFLISPALFVLAVILSSLLSFICFQLSLCLDVHGTGRVGGCPCMCLCGGGRKIPLLSFADVVCL